MEEMTIRGIIIPTEWNNRGEAVRVAIVTYDEDSYLVVDNEFGKTLAARLRERIIAKGRVNTSVTFKEIEIIQFSINQANTLEFP